MKKQISFIASLLLLVGWFSMNAAIYGEKNGDSVQYPEGAHNKFMAIGEHNAIVEGPRKIVVVMQKDSKKFKDTGAWGFEGVKGATKERVVVDAKDACFKCHESQKI